ncbi:hypothetical protein ACWDYH_00215 [Nocardia goodfellowii]
MSQFQNIAPSDFSSLTTDSFRYEWTNEKLWWIMEAAKGTESRFIITIDNRTGCAFGNLTIEGIRKTPGYGTYQVLLKSHDHADPGTWYPISGIGPIVEVSDNFVSGGVKWKALDIQRERREENPYYKVHEGIRRRDRERAEQREMRARRELREQHVV